MGIAALHPSYALQNSMDKQTCGIRYFVTYTGVKLPFNLTGELQAQEVLNRNTYFKGYFDTEGRLTGFDKLAYGDIELQHRYGYHADGRLSSAEITDIDGETKMLVFGEGTMT